MNSLASQVAPRRRSRTISSTSSDIPAMTNAIKVPTLKKNQSKRASAPVSAVAAVAATVAASSSLSSAASASYTSSAASALDTTANRQPSSAAMSAASLKRGLTGVFRRRAASRVDAASAVTPEPPLDKPTDDAVVVAPQVGSTPDATPMEDPQPKKESALAAAVKTRAAPLKKLVRKTTKMARRATATAPSATATDAAHPAPKPEQALEENNHRDITTTPRTSEETPATANGERKSRLTQANQHIRRLTRRLADTDVLALRNKFRSGDAASKVNVPVAAPAPTVVPIVDDKAVEAVEAGPPMPGAEPTVKTKDIPLHTDDSGIVEADTSPEPTTNDLPDELAVEIVQPSSVSVDTTETSLLVPDLVEDKPEETADAGTEIADALSDAVSSEAASPSILATPPSSVLDATTVFASLDASLVTALAASVRLPLDESPFMLIDAAQPAPGNACLPSDDKKPVDHPVIEEDTASRHSSADNDSASISSANSRTSSSYSDRSAARTRRTSRLSFVRTEGGSFCLALAPTPALIRVHTEPAFKVYPPFPHATIVVSVSHTDDTTEAKVDQRSLTTAPDPNLLSAASASPALPSYHKTAAASLTNLLASVRTSLPVAVESIQEIDADLATEPPTQCEANHTAASLVTAQ